MASRTYPPARLVHADSDYFIATWENVEVVVFMNETTMEATANVQRTFDDLASRFPGGIFLMTVVEQNAPMPSPKVRDALGQILVQGAGRMILSAVAHEGTGFRAAAVRSVVTGIAAFAKLSYPHKVFATVQEVGRWFWLNSPVARAWGEDTFSAAVAEVRTRVNDGARPVATTETSR